MRAEQDRHQRPARPRLSLQAPPLVLSTGPTELRAITDTLTTAIPVWGRALKRGVDIVSSAVVLVATLPVFAAIAIAVRLDSRGPSFFVQTRVGRDGRTFRFYKFRTMVVNNDDALHREYVASLIRGEGTEHDGMFKLTTDPRITRVGRFLRRYSLDELPQFLNVLLGDMTLVGPRPAIAAETDLYDDVARERLRVKPGLTGLWQVSGRCELTFWEMVALDVEYWRTWSPWLDLRILLRTPKAVLSARGAA